MSALSMLAKRKDLSLNCQVVVPLSKLPNFTSQRRYVRILFDGCMWCGKSLFGTSSSQAVENIFFTFLTFCHFFNLG